MRKTKPSSCPENLAGFGVGEAVAHIKIASSEEQQKVKDSIPSIRKLIFRDNGYIQVK